MTLHTEAFTGIVADETAITTANTSFDVIGGAPKGDDFVTFAGAGGGYAMRCAPGEYGQLDGTFGNQIRISVYFSFDTPQDGGREFLWVRTAGSTVGGVAINAAGNCVLVNGTTVIAASAIPVQTNRRYRHDSIWTVSATAGRIQGRLVDVTTEDNNTAIGSYDTGTTLLQTNSAVTRIYAGWPADGSASNGNIWIRHLRVEDAGTTYLDGVWGDAAPDDPVLTPTGGVFLLESGAPWLLEDGTPFALEASAILVTPGGWYVSDGVGGLTAVTMSISAGGGTGSPLSAPQTLTATSLSSTSIGLSWTAPASNGGSEIQEYDIERSTNGTTWTPLASTAQTSYTSPGLTAATLYYFRVRADNGVTLSAYSNTASATTGSGSVTTVPLADITGVHCLINSGLPHPEKFGFYCDEYGFDLSSVLLSVGKTGAETAMTNASTVAGYWDDWTLNPANPVPDHFDIIMPLGFAGTGRTTEAELEYVLAGGYDGTYLNIYNNLKAIAAMTGAIMVARIGNEPNLIAQPWAMLDVPQAKRDLYGRAFDHCAQIGKSIMPSMLAGYCPNHTATLTVDDYVNFSNVSAPAYHQGDTTIIYDWPLNRPQGMTEVDVYEIDLYMGNRNATQLVDDLEYVTGLAVRDNKLVSVPEWGMPDNKGTTLAQAVPRLQEMCDGFRAVGNRLIFHQYFDDQEPWKLSTWQGTNLRDDYVTIVLNDPA